MKMIKRGVPLVKTKDENEKVFTVFIYDQLTIKTILQITY